MSDAYADRLARAMAELEESGLRPLTYAPPAFHLSKRLGLRPRPPHYMSFLRAAWLTGLAWGAFAWVLQWRVTEMSPGMAALASLFAGLVLGLASAAIYRWFAGEAGLSKWEDL